MNRRPRSAIDARRGAGPARAARRSAAGGVRVGGVRITPTRVVLALALIGSLAYVAFAITVRDATQIPMLISGAIALGIVFVALAVSGAVSTWRAGVDGNGRRAFVHAVLGGGAAMIAAGCFAAAIILLLLLRS